MTLTSIGYMYRDAGNYKFRSIFLVDEAVRFDDIRHLLIDDHFFIPEKLGLLSLVPATKNDDDHVLHEFEEFLLCDIGQIQKLENFTSKLKKCSVEGWYSGT